MTRLTGPDCVVMCHLIHTHIHNGYKTTLRLMFPPKRFDIFPCLGDTQRVYVRSDFSWNRKQNDGSTSTRIEYIGENRHGLNFS